MTPAGERFGGRAWTLAACALVVAATLLVFAPTLSAGLVNWDDETGIGRNQGFRGLDAEHLGWMLSTSTLGHFQPLTWASLAVDHALWGLSPDPQGPELGRFHLTSVLLHAACATLFLLLGTRILARCLPSAGARARLAGATFAALFFALHPLRAESVAWLTERRDVLSGLLFVGSILCWWRFAEGRSLQGGNLRPSRVLGALLASALSAVCILGALDLSNATLALRVDVLGASGAVLFYIGLMALMVAVHLAASLRPARSGEQLLFAACVLLALGSLFSKAWGIVLPAVLLVLDLWPLARHAKANGSRSARWLELLAEKAPLFALTLVFARLAAWAQGSLPGTMVGLERHSIFERAVQGLYGLAWYPRKTLLPAGLSPYVELPAELSLTSPRFAFAALAVLVALGLAFALRRRVPALLTALTCFAVIVSPVLGVAQSGPQLVADRYSYLAGLPLALLVGGALVALQEQRPSWRTPCAALAAIWIALLGLTGAAQADVWHDSRSLWQHALAVDPDNGFAATKLAQVDLAQADAAADATERGRAAAAAWERLQANRREDDPIWCTTAAHALRSIPFDSPGERAANLERSVEMAQRAVGLQGDAVHPELRLNLATTLIEAGRPGPAVTQLELFTSARPAESLGWINLGVALAATGRAREAIPALERGLGLQPDYTKGWRFLALAREQAGQRAAALEAWRNVLQGWPRHAEARARIQALGG